MKVRRSETIIALVTKHLRQKLPSIKTVLIYIILFTILGSGTYIRNQAHTKHVKKKTAISSVVHLALVSVLNPALRVHETFN